MAHVATLTFTVRYPDVKPGDLDTLHEAIDAIPEWGHADLLGRLRDLEVRCARMLLTANGRWDAPGETLGDPEE